MSDASASIISAIGPAEERRSARLIVDLGAIVSNWRKVADQGGVEEAGAVVKADAYGMGADAVATALAAAGARTFFVATFGEGAALRSLLGSGPTIYVLNGFQGAASTYLGAGLRPVLNTLGQIAAWRSGSGGPAAIHVDTGMNRLGISLGEAGSAAALFPSPPLLMSHLACAATPEHPLNAVQTSRFHDVAALFPSARRSLAASAAALALPASRFGLVRPGIALYGDPGLDASGLALSVVATLEAPILQLRDAPAGEAVGYGASATLSRPSRLATIALGYADGYFRAASNKGFGVIAGVRCPILGRISMDLITLDVTDAPEAREGGFVEMMGAGVPLREVAAAASAAAYDVLTGLGRVSRTYIKGAA